MPSTLPRDQAAAAPDPASPRSEVTWRRLTLATLMAATALRLWLAQSDHSIYWPDEIYQSLEQAHRLAFGTGLIPWEFRDGARNWLLPGAIAGVWRVAALLGVQSSLLLVTLARGTVVLASAAALWWSARLATLLAGARAGLVAALVLALLPVSVVFGYRTISESISAPLIALSALLLLQRTRRGAVLAGVWITLAALLRYQNALFGLAFLAWLASERRKREAILFTAAGTVTLLLGGGLLDWLTWGRPFHSLFAYVDFNLLRGGASTFGVEPVWYYAHSLWTGTGPALIPLVLLAIAGGARVPALGLATLAYFLAHSLIPHKELRFIVPALPLACVLVGVGFDRLLQRSERESRWWWLGLGAASLAMALRLPHLTYRQMGQYLDTPRGVRTVWNADEETNLLLAEAGKKPDLCGLGALGLRPAFTGGYTYFHRDAPLLFAKDLCGAEPSVNYLIVPFHLVESRLPAGYTLITERSWLGLFRREGVCEPFAHPLDPLLDGAHDMGLQRPSAQQTQDGIVHFDLLRQSGSFLKGWGNGELLDCSPARWVTDHRAIVQFRAGALGMAYVLRARLSAYDGGAVQHLRMAFNGSPINDVDLPVAPTDVISDVPELRRGQNELSFEFSQTWKAGGDDPRELAALLESLELVPLADDFSLEVRANADPEHFAEGFSAPEKEGRQAFVWNDGPVSVVQGRLATPENPHLLSFTAQAIQGIVGRTRILVNSRLLQTLTIAPEWIRQELLVPPELLRRGLNRISFEYESTVTPAALSAVSTDHRQLAVRFRSLSLEALPSITNIDVGIPDARTQLLDGWSLDEVEGERSVVWTSGASARFSTWLGGAHDARLSINAHAYPPALPLEVEVRLNGTSAGSFRPGADWGQYEVTLPARAFAAGQSTIELRFNHTSRPSEHEKGSTDQRELALRVDRLVVTR